MRSNGRIIFFETFATFATRIFCAEGLILIHVLADKGTGNITYSSTNTGTYS